MSYLIPAVGIARRIDDAISDIDSDEIELDSDPESCSVLVGQGGVIQRTTPLNVLMRWLADPNRIEPIRAVMVAELPNLQAQYRARIRSPR